MLYDSYNSFLKNLQKLKVRRLEKNLELDSPRKRRKDSNKIRNEIRYHTNAKNHKRLL